MRCRLYGADECAEEFFVYFGSERGGVYIVRGEKFARILSTINARRFKFDLIEACGGEFRAVFIFIERSCDAANPEKNIFANFRGDIAAGDDV